MKIRDFQDAVKDRLNGVEALVQGGALAISEDTLDVTQTVSQHLQTAAGVALVVVTPELTRNGCAESGIPCDARLLVRCIEIPALNRAAPGHLTALDASEIVARTLDGTEYNYASTNETADERSGTVTATVTFNTEVNL